jgi:hypothetical protein
MTFERSSVGFFDEVGETHSNIVCVLEGIESWHLFNVRRFFVLLGTSDRLYDNSFGSSLPWDVGCFVGFISRIQSLLACNLVKLNG